MSAQILIVEDEHIVAKNLQHKLQRLGYQVPAIAASGISAIRKAKEIRPDLILMDIHLQGEMDGIRATEHILRDFHVPVVYLTAYTDEATLQRANDTAPSGYLIKPFVEQELRATIEIALHRHQDPKPASGSYAKCVSQQKESTSQNIQEAEALHMVGETLVSTLDAPDFLQQFCRSAMALLQGDCSCLAVWQANDNCFEVTASWGISLEQGETLFPLPEQRQPAARSFRARLVHERMVQASAAEEGGFLTEAFLRPLGMRHALCVGLWRGQDLIGMYLCGYRHTISLLPRTTRLASQLSHMGSLAMANTILDQELNAAKEVKANFLATMSHELRTPLHIMMGYTDLLSDGTFGTISEEQQEILQRIIKNARTLLSFVNALLDARYRA